MVQVDQAVSPSIAGVSAAQARQLGFSLSLKLTGWFALDALLALSVLVVATVLATARPIQEENSEAAFPSAPDARNPAMPSWS